MNRTLQILKNIQKHITDQETDCDRLAKIIIKHREKENPCNPHIFPEAGRSRGVGISKNNSAANIILAFIDEQIKKSESIKVSFSIMDLENTNSLEVKGKFKNKAEL